MKKTNLEKVKDIAIVFLDLPIEINETVPFMVNHPIFDNVVIPGSNENGSYKFLDLTKDEQLEEAIDMKEKQIMECDNAESVVWMIKKAYRLSFFKYIEQHLSEEDYARILASSWQMMENPNIDINCKVDEINRWFIKANKEYLMGDDYEEYLNLPEEITVYRGLGSKSNPYGLSWTLDKKKAEWFANRFDKGIVKKLVVKKENVLGYFGSVESEILVDMSKINKKDIQDA